MTMTMEMMVFNETGWMSRSPSIAEVTLMAGVINPSEISVAQPITAG